MSKGSKLGLLVLVVTILATAAVAEMSNNYIINTATNNTLGTYLVNQTGFTLYYFAKDMPGNSTCTGSCVTLWPPFYAKNVTVPTGLNATDFTSITRKDGMNQTAFKGWPLYHYSMDMKPGDGKGQAFKDIWFVVNPMKFPPK